jgi:hypothetical protein
VGSTNDSAIHGLGPFLGGQDVEGKI